MPSGRAIGVQMRAFGPADQPPWLAEGVPSHVDRPYMATAAGRRRSPPPPKTWTWRSPGSFSKTSTIERYLLEIPAFAILARYPYAAPLIYRRLFRLEPQDHTGSS